jgi:trk system potassium uptake protein TrkA
MKVLIIGGGQVGSYIADLLLNNNCTVKVIDNRETVLEKLQTKLPKDTVIFGSGTDPKILKSAGIAEADAVAAVTGADETNLVASTIAKFEYGVPRVIARVNNPKNGWLFNSGMGVDASLNQADLMAHLVIEEIDFKNMLTLMKINKGTYSIVQLKVDSRSKAAGRSVKDLTIPVNSLLIAVYRGNEVIIPHGHTVINANDIVMAFADKDTQTLLNTLFTRS